MSFSQVPDAMNITITTKSIIRVLFFGLLVWLLLFELKEVLLVVLTAVVIASFVESGVKNFKRIKIPRTIAVVIIYVVTIVLFALAFYLLVPTFLVEVSSLANLISGYLPESSALQFLQKDTLEGAREILRGLSSSGASLDDFLTNAQGFLSSISAGFIQTISTLFGGIVNLVLIFIISFYLSMQEKGIEHFLRIVTPYRHEEYAIDLWHRTRRKISLWVQGQFILGLIVGALTYIGLSIIGIEYALFLAVLTALMELIPWGIYLAVVPALSFAYLAGGVSMMLIVGLLYILIQQLENYFIAPFVVNKVVGISPLVVILAVVIGVNLAGFWGLILAIPVAVAILEFMADVERKKVFERAPKETVA